MAISIVSVTVDLGSAIVEKNKSLSSASWTGVFKKKKSVGNVVSHNLQITTLTTVLKNDIYIKYLLVLIIAA